MTSVQGYKNILHLVTATVAGETDKNKYLKLYVNYGINNAHKVLRKR